MLMRTFHNTFSNDNEMSRNNRISHLGTNTHNYNCTNDSSKIFIKWKGIIMVLLEIVLTNLLSW